MIYTEQDISSALLDTIKTKLRHCIKLAEAQYNRKFYIPKLDFSLTGGKAATAHSSLNRIRINPTLLIENEGDFVAQTIPHEMAHIVADTMYPNGHLDRKKKTANIPHHGTGWKHVMEVFGVPPTLYHNYAVAPSVTHRRPLYPHTCTVCSSVLQLPASQSALARANLDAVFHTKCGVHSKLIPLDSKIPPLTKLGKCEQLFLAFRNASRAEVIQLFVTHADATLAGGATYYSTLRKKYDR